MRKNMEETYRQSEMDSVLGGGTSQVFDELYMKKRLFLTWRAVPVVNAIDTVLNPGTVIDVGCSTGEFVAEFIKKGKIAYGLDSSKAAEAVFLAPKENFLMRNILSYRMKKLPMNHFDLCMCFEVVGFMDPQYHNRLVGNLYHLSDRVLLTVKESIQDYWREKFLIPGYEEDSATVEGIRKMLDPLKRKMAMRSVYYSLMCFRKKEVMDAVDSTEE